MFLAYENGKPVSRLIARISPELKDENGENIGMIGFFESFDNPDAVKSILDDAVKWLKGEGVGEIIGPINGDTWHKYRFNAGPFCQTPFMMEPYNKPYYCRLWEENGFVSLSHYYSKHVPDTLKVTERTEKYCKRLERRGFTFRKFKKNDFISEIKIIYKLSCPIFSDNYLYTEISESDFVDMYAGVDSFINPDLIWFALDPEGEYAGFVFAFPDYFKALLSMKGKKGIIAKIKFLLNKGKADTLNVKTLGVLPEYRGNGLVMALMHKAYDSGIKAGYSKANLCLIREGNSSGRVDMDAGAASREYNLYKYKMHATF